MTFTKSILLGAAAAITGVASAQAADLPSRKSAPVEYVRICDAYGAGYFFIPGTQTCLRIRAAFARTTPMFPRRTSARLRHQLAVLRRPASALASRAEAQHTLGWEARGRIAFDARTQTAWGTVQTVALLRMSRTTGVIASSDGRSGERPCDRPGVDA